MIKNNAINQMLETRNKIAKLLEPPDTVKNTYESTAYISNSMQQLVNICPLI